jgi:hypothetical protein
MARDDFTIGPARPQLDSPGHYTGPQYDHATTYQAMVQGLKLRCVQCPVARHPTGPIGEDIARRIGCDAYGTATVPVAVMPVVAQAAGARCRVSSKDTQPRSTVAVLPRTPQLTPTCMISASHDLHYIPECRWV